MNKKTRATLLVFVDILAVIIIIGMIVLGANLFKNRWHRIDFSVDSINVEETGEYGEYKYQVTVTGSAKTWFYDFNTYEFNLTAGTSTSANADGKITPSNVKNSNTIVANHKDNGTFEFSFETDDINDISLYVFKAENIYIDGNEKKGTDIRLFMEEHTEKIQQK